MKIFSERLFMLRKERNLTQEETAMAIGIQYRSYRRYEQGEREPQISALSQIALYFGVTSDFLLGLSDSRK